MAPRAHSLRNFRRINKLLFIKHLISINSGIDLESEKSDRIDLMNRMRSRNIFGSNPVYPVVLFHLPIVKFGVGRFQLNEAKLLTTSFKTFY